MARSYDNIRQEMTSMWMQRADIVERYNIQPSDTFDGRFRPVSVENIFLSIQAYAVLFLELVLDVFKSDIETTVAALHPHTIAWYIGKIKAFQYNDLLPQDSDIYDPIVEANQIVKYCSLVERQGYLYIKVAKQVSNLPEALTQDELNRLQTYINRIKDAGVYYEIVSRQADEFKCDLLIHYDPLQPITADTIKEVINEYLQSMPFDGLYSNMALTDRLQTLPNVKVVEVLSAASKYGTNDWQNIVSVYTPDSGYMSLNEEESVITLIPYTYAS
ncbi:MAG: hypothetical protein LBR17_08420 [Bacteroidales bacterium]|jgi:hypothetical protein|nr:hypothetical protein [Bacteroidales bacterium]